MSGAGPLIIGHRGAPTQRRENTIDSFAEALSSGADGVEFDVRSSRDALVVHHDASLRLRGRRKNLSLTPKQTLPRWLPSLAEVADWAATSDCLLDVELKEPGKEGQVVDHFSPLLDRCVFTSFYPDAVAELRRLAPDARVGWITKSEPDAVLFVAKDLAPDLVVLPFRRCQKALVEPIRALGVKVWAWNVNSIAAADRMAGLGVEALITDRPRELAKWRDARKQQRTTPRKGLVENSIRADRANAGRTRPR